MLGELLRRLFGGARSSGGRRSAAAPQPKEDAGQRIDAARERLKATIPPPDDQPGPAAASPGD